MSEARVIANRYQITDLLDRGGMGDVYKALDQTTGQPVAIKALKPQIVQEDPTLLERFRREAAALAKLNHPNIVRVLDTLNEGDRHYIIMEYVGGGSLDALLKTTPQLPIERALQLALDLSDALTRTHRLNIIHRDLKPANVLLADDGMPKLTDFGVARIGDAPGTMLTQIGTVLGTVAYLSPEICEGGKYNEQTDIWAFGVMLYQMLTGHLPFEETTAVGTIAAILGDDVPDPRQYRSDIPDAVVELLKSMMAKKPEDRLPSARAIGAEIEAILKPAPKTDRTPTVEAAPVQESAPPTPAPVAAEPITSPAAPTPARTAPVTPGSMPPVTLPPRPSAQTRQKSKEPIIFMCYRREDTGEIAGRIHEQLVKTFGESSILRDVDRISDRTVSRLVLANDVVSHSDVMVIVIGRNWAGVGETPAGKPKGITNPKDPIRIQIEAALKQPGMLILPVLVDGATLPADLPPSLQPIAATEPVVISDAALDGQMKKIVGRIRSQYSGLSPRRVRQLIAVVVFILLLIIAFVLVQNGAALPSIIPWLSASPL
ncbi:MAG: serine/threonine protein kinase [Chloroflexi bacterium]|nr:serine/threonine protein kinase [Chloroflexota bacterium]